MMRILVTGATGFIGRHCLPTLATRGYEIHAVSSKSQQTNTAAIHWHQLDLFDSGRISELLSKVSPSHLLHLAWYVVPGKLASAYENFLWVQASLELLRQFHLHGGRRVLLAGSAYEYDWNYGYCSELITPTAPATFYGACKSALQSLVAAYSKQTGLSSAWARLFFLYGPHEHPKRLVSSVICSLLRGEPARCSHGKQLRDYLHVQDVADALVTLIESDIIGPVNIGSGYPIAIKDIVYKIAKELNAVDLVQMGAIESQPYDSPLVVADISRISHEAGWNPRYDIDHGLEQTISWWKAKLNA